MSTTETPMGGKSEENRCAFCYKIVRLYKFICRCGAFCCPFHRFTDRHNCTFDYESHGVEPVTSISALKVELDDTVIKYPPINGQPDMDVSNAPAKRKRNRCSFCRSLVGFYGRKCPCGGLYCSIHRPTDRHNCTFDYELHAVWPITTKCRQIPQEEVEAGAVDEKALAAPSRKEQHDKEVSNEPAKRKRYRCAVCRILVGLYGHKCQCGGLYCSIHRSTDSHNCAFDQPHGFAPLERDLEPKVEQRTDTQNTYQHYEYTMQSD